MPSAGFQHVARTHVGCRRELNEDAVLECPDRGLWAVADGMGGHEAGEVASRIVVEALAACPPGTGEHELVQSVRASLEVANARLVSLSRAEFGGRTIGSTIVALVAGERNYTCFWAGDSRAYLVRDGAIERLTRDHSMVQDLVDAGMLGEEEAQAHPNANIITRAVGVSDVLEVDTVSGEIRADDVFLLATDGLTRLVSDDELLAELRGGDIADSASRLLKMTLERGAADNVSLVILRRLT